MEAMNSIVRAEWHVDFGESGRLEAELEKSRLWLALPSPLETELWLKNVGTQDFRVLLTRSTEGLLIRLDRGPGANRNWPASVPTIGVRLDHSGRRGVVFVRNELTPQDLWHDKFIL